MQILRIILNKIRNYVKIFFLKKKKYMLFYKNSKKKNGLVSRISRNLQILVFTLFVCKMAQNDVSHLFFPKYFHDCSNLYLLTWYQLTEGFNIKNILATAHNSCLDCSKITVENQLLREEIFTTKQSLEILQNEILRSKEETIESRSIFSFLVDGLPNRFTWKKYLAAIISNLIYRRFGFRL